jgi:hypothetical protein
VRSALLSRSLTRPLSAGKGRSRRVDRVLACSASGPLLTPHTRRQGYFRPRSPDTSHLGPSSPFQRRSTLAFAEDSCRCPRYSASCRQVYHIDAMLVCNPVRRHRILAEAPRGLQQCMHSTPNTVKGDHGLGPCADPGYTGPAFFACIVGRRVSLYVRHRSSGLKAWGDGGHARTVIGQPRRANCCRHPSTLTFQKRLR